MPRFFSALPVLTLCALFGGGTLQASPSAKEIPREGEAKAEVHAEEGLAKVILESSGTAEILGTIIFTVSMLLVNLYTYFLAAFSLIFHQLGGLVLLVGFLWELSRYGWQGMQYSITLPLLLYLLVYVWFLVCAMPWGGKWISWSGGFFFSLAFCCFYYSPWIGAALLLVGGVSLLLNLLTYWLAERKEEERVPVHYMVPYLAVRAIVAALGMWGFFQLIAKNNKNKGKNHPTPTIHWVTLLRKIEKNILKPLGRPSLSLQPLINGFEAIDRQLAKKGEKLQHGVYYVVGTTLESLTPEPLAFVLSYTTPCEEMSYCID